MNGRLLLWLVAAGLSSPAVAQSTTQGLTPSEWKHYKYEGTAFECNTTVGNMSLQFDIVSVEGGFAPLALIGLKDNDIRVEEKRRSLDSLPIGTQFTISSGGVDHRAVVAKRGDGKTYFATDLPFLAHWWFDETQNITVWLSADRSVHADRIIANGTDPEKDRVTLSNALRCVETSMIGG